MRIMVAALGMAASVLTVLAGAGPVLAQPGSPPRAPSYDDPASWLCRPGRSDACSRADEDATVVRADGSTLLERFHPAADPPVDCFYVYPTVSRDPGGNASMAAEPEEVQVVEQQFARFASKCRLYAPLYRQVTLTALQATMMGRPNPGDPLMAYKDVLDAWNAYLAHDNHGRGVVLIGHSQGSGILIRLVKNEIDAKPIQGRILSVILGGARLQVPAGQDVGGDFKSIPLCRSPTQLGCAINFASFRATSPPPANSRFGASSGPGLKAACVNPAALDGGVAPLDAYLASGAQKIVAATETATPPWTNPPKPIATPFVKVPGLLSASCIDDGAHNFLAVYIRPNPGGARTDQISGDVVVGGHVLADWGLHLIDMNLVMGDLLEVVGQETDAYLGKAR